MSYAIESITMTNLENNNSSADIHLNISSTFDFICENLPEKYSREVWNLLPKDKRVDLAYIRQVKKDRIVNEAIINALYLVAQRNKKAKEKS